MTDNRTTDNRTTDNRMTNERQAAIAECMNDIRAIEADLGVTHAGVEAIRDRLVQLTEQAELFSMEAFPPPTADDPVGSRLYRIAQDDDDRFALYANASRGGVASPVHNHTTWAVVVGFEGQELNRFYVRDAAESGEPGVVQTGEHMVERGTGVAMLPDDLHSIHIDGPALNFHCYGLALERLDERQYLSARTGEWKVFPAHSDIAEARADGAVSGVGSQS